MKANLKDFFEGNAVLMLSCIYTKTFNPDCDILNDNKANDFTKDGLIKAPWPLPQQKNRRASKAQ